MGRPLLARISTQKTAQDAWQAWLTQHLPPSLAARISGVSEQAGVLTVFTESAAWSARLRFALIEIETEVRVRNPNLIRVAVRVLPRGLPGA